MMKLRETWDTFLHWWDEGSGDTLLLYYNWRLFQFLWRLFQFLWRFFACTLGVTLVERTFTGGRAPEPGLRDFALLAVAAVATLAWLRETCWKPKVDRG